MCKLVNKVEIAPEGGLFVVKYAPGGKSQYPLGARAMTNIPDARESAIRFKQETPGSYGDRTEYVSGEILVSEYGPGFYCYTESPFLLDPLPTLLACWIPGGTRLYYNASRTVVAAEVLVVL